MIIVITHAQAATIARTLAPWTADGRLGVTVHVDTEVQGPAAPVMLDSIVDAFVLDTSGRQVDR